MIYASVAFVAYFLGWCTCAFLVASGRVDRSDEHFSDWN
jgi:hypothetical protein